MTAVYLLPTGDGNVDNFLHEGGGSTSLWTHIDDPVGTPTDADYIRGQGSYVGPPLCRYIAILADPTLTADQRVARMRVQHRLASTAAGVGKALRYRLVIPNVWSGPMWLSETASASFVDGGGPWIVPPSTSGETQTQTLAKLRVEYQGSPYSGGGDSNAKISQAYVELDRRTRASVGTPTVTGNTTTSRPTVTASYNDAVDNQDSTRRQVKVFAASVYGGAGFGPDASPATWDSGQLSLGAAPGADMAAVVGVDLVDGATYKAYVRAAKDFNGTPWWSDWAVSAAFTMVLTKPDAPLITATGDVNLDLAKLRAFVQLVGATGDASDRLHLERAVLASGMLNLAHPQVAGGTEETATADGFYSSSALDGLDSDDRNSVMGHRSLKWTIGAISSRLTIGLPPGTITLDDITYATAALPGKTVVCSVYLACPAGPATSATLGLEAVDQFGSVVGTAATKAITIPATATSTRFSIALTVDAGAFLLRPYLQNTSGVTGQQINVDNIQVREGADPDTQPWVRGQGQTPLWVLVRGADLLDSGTLAQPRVVIDEEVPVGRPIAYKATVVRAPDASTRVSSNPAAPATVIIGLPTRSVLKDPLRPQLAMQVRILAGPDQIAEQVEVLYPHGAPYPVVRSAGLTGLDRAGLEILIENHRDAAVLTELLRTPSALYLQDLRGGGRYVRIISPRNLDVQAEEVGEDAMTGLFTVDVVETAAPV